DSASHFSGPQAKWDVFLSYAHEDKSYARQLVTQLRRIGMSVWFDELNLKVGASLREALDNGIIGSRYGVVLLTKHYFAKLWTLHELDALLALESPTERRVLPVWHEITFSEVRQWSPLIASRVALVSSSGLPELVRAIHEAVHPEGRMLMVKFEG